MKSILKSKQSGFAIIEALIAFLLLGIGVAALLYLQGNLMIGSSTSKARAEAMELAKDRTELLRNYIQKDQFEIALYSAVQAEPATLIKGINAEYSVSYELDGVIIDKAKTEEQAQLLTRDAQQLTVAVSWKGSDDESENVQLDTMLYFTDPVILSNLGSDGSGEGGGIFPLVSPWITGVEGEHESTYDLPTLVSTVVDDHRVMNLDVYGNLIFSDIGIDIKTYTNSSTGRSNVEVVDGTNADGTPNVVLTSFGGIVHRLQGDVIVDDNAGSTLSTIIKKQDILALFASPPSYCLFSICDVDDDFDISTEVCEKSNGAEFVSYVCYVPGDCTYGSVGDDGEIDSRCPDPFSTDLLAPPFAPPVGMDDLNGGWYGKVGNFNVDLPGDKVCTAQTAGKLRTPSRDYVTHRVVDGVIVGNEGINTPYNAQTFLIVDKNDDCSVQIGGIPENNLVNDHIERQLYGAKRPKTSPLDLLQDNVVFPLNECVGGLDCPPPTPLLP